MSAAPPPREEDAPGADRESACRQRLVRVMMQVLWPAFLMAIVTEGVLFSMIDPQELAIVGMYLSGSREAAYTVSFLVFWALFACASGITYLLGHGMRGPPGDRRP